MSRLALDLGTTTGWAWAPMAGAILSGTWKLAPKKSQGEGDAERFMHLREELDRFRASAPSVDSVSFEEVFRHQGHYAARVYCGLLAVLQIWAREHRIPLIGVGVGVIKKFWTGKGNADKSMMIAEARLRSFEPADDNEADALALLHHQLIGEDACESTPKKSLSASRRPRLPRKMLGRTSSVPSARRLLSAG